MSQTFHYQNAIDASPTFNVDLGGEVVRLGEEQGFTELAEHLQSGSDTIILDDPDGDVGNSGDAILGNQRFNVDEDDCAAPRIYEGFIGARRYSRGDGSRPSLVTGSQRQIAVELHDLNTYASLRVIPQTNRDAIRPRETVSERFAWIIGTGYLAYIHDNGLIFSNTTMMDATTGDGYRGQRPIQVINDCEQAAGFGWNCFVYWDDAAGEASWWFGNSNTSTAFTSSLQISNDPADCDTLTVATFETGTIFAPMRDGVLSRDPTEQGDSGYEPFRNGAVFATRAATTEIYGQKDLIVPNANVRTKERALAMLNDILFQHRNEDDRITCTVELPTSKVNLIKAGHRMQVKFLHLPGYESYVWCRVLRRTVGQRQKTKTRYQVELELSPQEAGEPAPPCSDDATPDGTYWPLGGSNVTSESNPSDGVVFYARPGDFFPSTPTSALGTTGHWHFPQFGAGGTGTIDYAGDCVENTLGFIVVGNGAMAIQSEVYAGSPRPMRAYIMKPDGTVINYADTTSGAAIYLTIDDATEDDCIRLVQIHDGPGSPCGGKWGWSQMDWVGA